MDENKVALIVAVIGLVGGLLGAGIGGWAAVRGAKQQAAAALMQAEAAARHEEGRWLRDRRHECCVRLHRSLERAWDMAQVQRARPSISQEQIQQLGQLREELFADAQALMLTGPVALSTRGLDATAAAVELLEQAIRREEESSEASQEWSALMSRFVNEVQEELGFNK